ncbi:MAG: lipopolysaccharide heptosyltransferase II [Elusimicrobiota bacterium]
MPNKILIIRFSSLGDVILTAPIFRSIKARWPDSSVSILVKKQFAPVLEENSFLDEIITFEGILKTARRIRKGGFTHLLDLHANLRSRLIRLLCRVPSVSIYRKHALSRRLFVLFGIKSPSLEKHTLQKYLDALAAWGIPERYHSVEIEDYQIAGRNLSPTDNPSKILIIQNAFLGDALLTIPLIEKIKSLYPQSELSVLTLERTADIFRASSAVKKTIIDDKKNMDGGFSGILRLARRLRTEHFNMAIIPHRSFRSALLAYLSQIPKRVGFSSSAGRLFLTDIVPWTWLMPDLERNLTLLKPLSRAGPVQHKKDDSVYLRSDGYVSPSLDHLLDKLGIVKNSSGLIVGVHPGSAWPTKRWLPERFSDICRRLSARGLIAILVGSSGDANLCARIAEESGALNLCGKTDLKELQALMNRFSLFITNDSGPMHLAAGCGVPTLAIFGPTTRELGFFPYGSNHRVLEADLKCRPCRLHGGKTCPHGHFLCMNLITADHAWNAANEMLGLAPPAESS